MEGITIIGLGPGSSKLLTREAFDLLINADEIYLRTNDHPTLKDLDIKAKIISFDSIYKDNDDFQNVYNLIVEKILKLGERSNGVVYAVPGHPLIAEYTGPKIIELAKEKNIPVKLVEGISFISPTFAAIGVDPLPQANIIDGMELAITHHPIFSPSSPTLIAQVYSKILAGEVKINLMNVYPDNHPVQLVHGAGTENLLVENIPLYKIDLSDNIGLLTSLYVPSLRENTSFEKFQELISHLRSPVGCAWDREQTHQTLRENLLEETHEVLEAIDKYDVEAMKEEFGDLLLQIVLQSQIAFEEGSFSMEEVIEGIYTKLVRRHPHVFGDKKLDNSEAIINNWEILKENERKIKGEDSIKGILSGVSKTLPSLSVANNYQKRAARVGFDFPTVNDALNKFMEEVKEFVEAETDDEKEDEMGDIVFGLVNVARWFNIDVETALRRTNRKFRFRFEEIEKVAKAKNIGISDIPLVEMEEIWEDSKN